MAVAIGLGIAVAIPWILAHKGAAPFEEHVRPFFVDTPAWFLPVWVILRIVGSVVVAPIVEELAFRGYLMRRLVARDFDQVPLSRWTPLAVLGSSLLFGVPHQRWILGSVAGLVYAIAVIRRGRLLDGSVAHATTNALVAVCVLKSGDWSMWLWGRRELPAKSPRGGSPQPLGLSPRLPQVAIPSKVVELGHNHGV